MAKVVAKRVTAQIEGDFVVFLIGMRINWVDFNQRVGNSRGDVGIGHETYKVRAGEYECVYSGMPVYGLAKASSVTDAVGRFESAEGRLGIVAQNR